MNHSANVVRNKRIALLQNLPYLLLALLVLVICTYTALHLDTSQCPDEAGRYKIPLYIFQHGRLPYGWEPEIRLKDWGFSYAFMPYLPAILSAGLMRIAAAAGAGTYGLLVAARLVSAICVSGATFIACKLGEKVCGSRNAGLLCGVVVGCTPQVIFVGSYVNNDAMALLAVLIMVYSWVLGCTDESARRAKHHRASDEGHPHGPSTAWRPGILVLMAIGISLALLSYYNSYGFILLSPFVFAAAARRQDHSWGSIARGILLLASVAFLLAGWHFIRNIIIYQGDIFGMRMRREFGELYGSDIVKPSNRAPRAQGLSPWQTFVGDGWFVTTILSFFCVTGLLDVHTSAIVYLLYAALSLASVVGCLVSWHKDRHPERAEFAGQEDGRDTPRAVATSRDRTGSLPREVIAGLVCAGLITVALSMWYSYATDFQPQGRYIFACMSAYALIITCGIDGIATGGRGAGKTHFTINPCAVVTLVWIALLIVCYADCLVPCFLPRSV